MMTSLKPCIICYKPASPSSHYDVEPDIDSDNPRGTTTETMTRFFYLLGRHVEDPSGKYRDNGDNMLQFPFEQVIKAGLSSTCRDCSLLAVSFCDLYDQMKTIELMLNWKVWTLKNVILRAHRDPSRLNTFRRGVEQLEMGDVTADEIIDFKGELVKKCGRTLRATFPRLMLHKWRPQQEVAEQSPQNSEVIYPMDEEEEEYPEDVLSEGDKRNRARKLCRKATHSVTEIEEQVDTEESSGPDANAGPSLSSHLLNYPTSTTQICNSETSTKQNDNKGLGKNHKIARPQIIRQRSSGKKIVRFKCTACGTEFNRRANHDRHYLSRHLGLRFNCDACGKTFTRKDLLTVHQCGKNLPKGRPPQVPNFIQQQSDTGHMTEVNGSSNHACPKVRFSCQLCNKSFSQKGQLCLHVRSIHLGERFKCAFCSMSFDNVFKRNYHARINCSGKRSDLDG